MLNILNVDSIIDQVIIPLSLTPLVFAKQLPMIINSLARKTPQKRKEIYREKAQGSGRNLKLNPRSTFIFQ